MDKEDEKNETGNFLLAYSDGEKLNIVEWGDGVYTTRMTVDMSKMKPGKSYPVFIDGRKTYVTATLDENDGSIILFSYKEEDDGNEE